jgi:hypothetical protein
VKIVGLTGTMMSVNEERGLKMKTSNSNKGRPLSIAHCEAIAEAQKTRKINSNNNTGHKNVRKYKNSYIVEVAGTYIGCRKTIVDAIKIRDEARERLL